jgi:hypothetical protein
MGKCKPSNEEPQYVSTNRLAKMIKASPLAISSAEDIGNGGPEQEHHGSPSPWRPDKARERSRGLVA